MIGLHSTQLKKIYSRNFETSALQPVNLIASEVLQPTVEIKPNVDVIYSSDIAGSNTLFTVASDRDFILQGISFNTGSAGGAYINIEVDGVGSKTILHTAESQTLNFNQGIIVRRGTAVTLFIEVSGSATVWGYYGSDRA